MKILMISGFLGAGKTTFIQALHKATGRSFCIVENEFAAEGVDAAILQEGDAALKVWELSEGCICCSVNLDFTHSILTIANSLDPDYLLIEPSGVAMPGNILAKLKSISYERIGLLAPITLVDAQHYQRSRRDFPDYFADQLQHGHRIVLSKSEDLDEAAFRAIGADLGLREDQLFPLVHYSRWPVADWWSLLEDEIVFEPEAESQETAGADSAKTVMTARGMVPRLKRSAYKIVRRQRKAEDDLESISLPGFAVTTPVELVNRMNILMSGVLGRIVRAKGFCPSSAGPLRFDFVEGSYVIGAAEGEQGGLAVIIGQNLEKDALKKLFGPLP